VGSTLAHLQRERMVGKKLRDLTASRGALYRPRPYHSILKVLLRPVFGKKPEISVAYHSVSAKKSRSLPPTLSSMSWLR
jgi:hypothetical protein